MEISNLVGRRDRTITAAMMDTCARVGAVPRRPSLEEHLDAYQRISWYDEDMQYTLATPLKLRSAS